MLRIINRFNIGGPTYNATFLTCYLPDEYETMLIGGHPEQGEADSLHICQKYGVSPVLLEEMQRKPSLKTDVKTFFKIRKIIKEFKPDIVHTHAAKAGVLGRLAAFSCGVKVRIHTFHGHVFHSYFGKTKTTIFKRIEQFMAVLSTRIVAISPLQMYELTTVFRIVKPEKIALVPLGFDLNIFQEKAIENREITRKEYNLQKEEVAIALIGRLTAIKNHTFLIDVLANIQKETTKEITLFIVGDGELKDEIEAYSKNINWNKNVKIVYTSWIKEVNVFVAGMDIVALCSLNEGTPVSLIEAQAANVCVISNDIGGVHDIVSTGKTGSIVTKLDTLEYTKKLLRLIEDDSLREEMRANGWDFVRERFHYSRLIEDMDKLYKQVLNKE